MFPPRAPAACAGLALLAVAACNSAAVAQNDGQPASYASVHAPRDQTTPASGSLEEELARIARDGQQMLPRRRDPITTVVAFRAEGRELVYEISISTPFFRNVGDLRADYQQGNQLGMCNNPIIARLVQRGATLRHIYTDSERATFFTRVTSCPPIETVTTPPLPDRNDPALSAELVQRVEADRSLMPLRIDPTTQAVSQRVEGIELITEIRVSTPFPSGRELFRQAIQRHNQRSACAQPVTAALVRRGASLRTDYTDSTGAAVFSRVISCP